MGEKLAHRQFSKLNVNKNLGEKNVIVPSLCIPCKDLVEGFSLDEGFSWLCDGPLYDNIQVQARMKAELSLLLPLPTKGSNKTREIPESQGFCSSYSTA